MQQLVDEEGMTKSEAIRHAISQAQYSQQNSGTTDGESATGTAIGTELLLNITSMLAVVSIVAAAAAGLGLLPMGSGLTLAVITLALSIVLLLYTLTNK